MNYSPMRPGPYKNPSRSGWFSGDALPVSPMQQVGTDLGWWAGAPQPRFDQIVQSAIDGLPSEGEIFIPKPEATYSIPSFGDKLAGTLGDWWSGIKGGWKKAAETAFDQRDKTSGLLTKQGWFIPSLYGIQAIGGLVDANRQYKLGKQSLNFQKEAFYTNLENQRKLTNAELERKAQARLDAGTTKESVEDYMKRYGV